MRLEIPKGIKTKLAANSTITTAVSTRIYRDNAPENPTRPYIIFALNAGGDENVTQTRSADVRYAVQAVSESAIQAAQIGVAIEAALHDQEFATDAPVEVFDCHQIGWIEYIEWVDRKPIYHNGGVYRVRATS